MKIIKKSIIVLFIIIGMLTLGMLQVEAASVPSLPGSNGKVNTNKLTDGSKWYVRYNVEYKKYHNRNLFCVEHGQHLWSAGRTYKVLAHIKIKNSVSWRVTENNPKQNEQDTSNAKISLDYNKKLATGLAILSGQKQQNFIWGYMKTWVENVGKKYAAIPNNFATQSKSSNYSDITEEVTEAINDAESSLDDFKLKYDKDQITFMTLNLDGKEYTRVGPYQLNGIPSEGIKSFTITDQNEDKIKGAKIIRYRSGNPSIIDLEDEVFKNGINFYICIPKTSKATEFGVELTTNKVKTSDVTADIYFLKCSDITWQNLIVTKASIDKSSDKESVTIPKTSLPVDLTVIKADENNPNEKLDGAQFIFFRYVKDDNGSWYKNKEENGYTQDEKETNDKNTKYCREYLSQANSHYYTYVKTTYEKIQNNANYIFTTKNGGKISLENLKPGTYYAIEVKAPEGYKKIEGSIRLKKVESLEQESVTVKNTPDTTTMDLVKVNKDNHEVKLEGVRFRFKNEEYGWIKNKKAEGNYEYTNNENEAYWFETEKGTGKIHLDGLPVGDWTYVEDPTSLPYGYDITGKEKGTFKLESKDTNAITVENEQKWVKLSGFVWVDKVGVKSGDGKDRNDLFKTNETGEIPDDNDLLFDGITVKLMDRTTNQIAKDKNGKELVTTTSNLGRYTEDGHNGHGEYLFEDVLIEKLKDYYIEFTYDGLNYTNVIPHLDKSSGSKAAESTNIRNSFNEKFSVIEGKTEDTGVAKGKNGGEINLPYQINEVENGREARLTYYDNYKIDQNNSYIEPINPISGDISIIATTNNPVGTNNKPNYIISDYFTYGQEEVKYINLGLKDRDRPDLALGKDIQNVKLSINGKAQVYGYDKRYNGDYKEYTEGETFNVGVRFKTEDKQEPYPAAIYRADYEYENPNDRSRELKVYVTYKLHMLQSNVNLKAQVNSIVDYFDQEYTLERIGTEISKEDGNVGGTIIAERKDRSVNRSY